MLRRVVLILIVLVVVVLIGAAAAVALIDPDDYRDEIAARATELLGREVRLDGPIDLKLWPRLAFEIQDARLGNPPEMAALPLLAEIGRATASLRERARLRDQVDERALTGRRVGVDRFDHRFVLVRARHCEHGPPSVRPRPRVVMSPSASTAISRSAP